jgi:hypothetical protein
VGYPPFYSDDRMALYQHILQGKIEYPRHVSKQVRASKSGFLWRSLLPCFLSASVTHARPQNNVRPSYPPLRSHLARPRI